MSINTLTYQKYYDPWEHVIVDNFYDENLFLQMEIELTLLFNAVMPNRNIMFLDDVPALTATNKCVSSKPINSDFLKLFLKHRPYTTLKVRNQVIFCNGVVDYNIHDEKESKILSAVTYVTPSIATGTRLYYKDKSFCKDVDWAKNKTLLFCGDTDSTWHSYHSTENTHRITINTFIETI